VFPPIRPPLRHEVFVTRCYSPFNEDQAIIKLDPLVHKDDFNLLSKELKVFFRDVHEVRVAEIHQCPLGDAYVRFGSPLEREKFLGPVFRFGNYRMTVVKHDEGDNARSFELHRETWVMLLGFPEDLRTTQIVAKWVSTFGIMVHWHESLSLARVIVKVYLNDDGKIPDFVKVNAGLPSKGRSWIVPIFVLKKKNVLELPDKEAYVTTGPLHPMPP